MPRAAKKRAPAEDTTSEFLGGLREAIGVENAMLLGSDEKALKIRGVISTRIPTLDVAIGRGGIPLGRLSILHGDQGCGKTTVALQLAAECQAQGGLAVYFDHEYKLDPDYACDLGVDPHKLIISQPRSLELFIKGVQKVIELAPTLRERHGRSVPIIVVCDSLNAIKAEASLEADPTDKRYPDEARVLSQKLPQIIREASKEDVALLFISQIRKKLGVMYGDADEIAGGNAPKFYASLIMKVVRTGYEKEDGVKNANKIEIECKKNQIARPFRRARLRIVYGKGVDMEHSLVLALEDAGILQKEAKSWYAYDGERLANGTQAMADFLRKNVNLRDEFTKELRSKMKWQ